MYFIDTHLHLQAYNAKTAPQIIAEALACGVNKLICASITEADWPLLAALADEFAGEVIPAFGVHPWYLETLSEGWAERLVGYLQRYPVAMIGETGLDRLKNPTAKTQQSVFAEHIRLSQEFGRPLLIHAVKAQDWLESYWPALSNGRFVLHSYNGRADLLSHAIAAGGYISFSNSVLRNRDFAELVTMVPASRLLVETDGPFQGEMGQESHPCQIPILVEKIAAARHTDFVALAEQIYTNSLRFIDV